VPQLCLQWVDQLTDKRSGYQAIQLWITRQKMVTDSIKCEKLAAASAHVHLEQQTYQVCQIWLEWHLLWTWLRLRLKPSGSLTTLHWILNHTHIEGNEWADALAYEATNLTNTLHVEQTPGAYKHMITKFLHHLHVYLCLHANNNNTNENHNSPL